MYELLNLIVAIGVPSTVMAYIFHRFEKRQDKKEQEVEEKTDKQERLQIIILDTLNANIELSEATARAVQRIPDAKCNGRIPDAKCNGDMHAAIDKIKVMKDRQNELIEEQGIKHIMN